MRVQYEDKEEDKRAIELIIELGFKSIEDMESVFKKQNLPLRERYVYYYIGQQHQLYPKDKARWGTEDCRFRFSGLRTDWWEKYLTFFRPLKLKIREELHPDLPKMDISEIHKISEQKDLHEPFIKKGYFYREQIDKSLDEMMEFDLSDPMPDDYSSEYMSIWQVEEELKEIDMKYDTYILKQIKPKNNVIESIWCPVCSEAPCMCSDPDK